MSSDEKPSFPSIPPDRMVVAGDLKLWSGEKVTMHQISGGDQSITVDIDERDPKYGGASHEYMCSWTEADGFKSYHLTKFQRGPIAEVGVNGVTNEVLLAMVATRLQHFQAGPFACAENQVALESVMVALEALHGRTRARIERGVEGKNIK